MRHHLEPSSPSSPSSHPRPPYLSHLISPRLASPRLTSLRLIRQTPSVVRLLNIVLGKVPLSSVPSRSIAGRHPPVQTRGWSKTCRAHTHLHLSHSITALPLRAAVSLSCSICDDLPQIRLKPSQTQFGPASISPNPSRPRPARLGWTRLGSTRLTVASDPTEPISGCGCRRRLRGSPPWRSSMRAPTSTT